MTMLITSHVTFDEILEDIDLRNQLASTLRTSRPSPFSTRLVRPLPEARLMEVMQTVIATLNFVSHVDPFQTKRALQLLCGGEKLLHVQNGYEHLLHLCT